MTTFQAFTFITSVVIVAWACVVFPPAGVLAIIYWFTASQAARNAARRKQAMMEASRPADSPRRDQGELAGSGEGGRNLFERDSIMLKTHEVEQMTCVAKGANHGPAPIPQEGRWTPAREVKDICGFTHGIGWCAPQQGACKLSLNVKDGVIQEALVETIGCSGMTHSAAMAAEILTGRTILEALNTDLVCDAINTAMRELFLQIVYGRTQSAFSEGGLPIGAGLEDLGKGLRSMTATMYSTVEKGPRYLELTEGYVLKMGLDENGEVIGYQFLKLGPMVEMIKKGVDANEAFHKSIGQYGRFDEAARVIDPRHE